MDPLLQTDKSEELEPAPAGSKQTSSEESEKIRKLLGGMDTASSSKQGDEEPEEEELLGKLGNENPPIPPQKSQSEEKMFYLISILCKNLPLKPSIREEIIKEFSSQLLTKEILRIKQQICESSEEGKLESSDNDTLITRIIKDSQTLPKLLSEYSRYNSENNSFQSQTDSDQESTGNSLLNSLKEYADQDPVFPEEEDAGEEGPDGKKANSQEQEDGKEEGEKDDSNYKDDLKRLLCSSLSKEKDEDDTEMTQEMEEYDKQASSLDQELDDFQKTKPEKVEEKEEEVEEVEEEIKGPIMSISNDSLSYERFYPGRILGNTFQITNKAPKKTEVTLSFTTKGLDKAFIIERLMEFYEASTPEEIEQPYLSALEKPFADSQKDFNCWYIEDPKTKSLVKEATLELDPGESYEFIVVLKSPIIKKSNLLLTNVKWSMKVLSSKCKLEPEEHVVLAFGSLDVPKLICPKEIMDEDKNYSSVKVVMRKNAPVQVFRFLMINKGDMPINVHFTSLENDEMLLFAIKNRSMSLEPNQRAILELKANHKFKSIPNEKWKTMNTHKLIIGKIQDWELKFSLIVDVIIIN